MDSKKDKTLSDGMPNSAPYGKQISKIEILKAQVLKDSIEAEGKWKPFKDVRYEVTVLCVHVYVCV